MDPRFLKAVRRIGFVLGTAILFAGCGRASAHAEGLRKTADFATSPDGIQLAYEAHGEGTPALVFVHGWSCDRSYWKGQLQSFSRQFKVVAVDLAGHGESGVGRAAWTMGAFGGDVAAVVEKLGLERVILIGHSMGGDVIVEAARRLPGRVAGLVWVDTYKQLRAPRTPEQLQGQIAPFRSDFVETTRAFVRGMFPSSADRSLVERVAADMSAAPPAVALGAMESAMSFDREIPRALQELKLPVVAINPDYRPTDVPSMERYGIEVVIMPGVGHFLMMEDPERFNRLLTTVTEKFVRGSGRAQEGAPLPTVALPAALARVLTDYEAAWQGKDAAALAALFTEDGFVLSGGTPPVRGRAPIEEHYNGKGGPLSLRALAFATEGSVGYIIGGYTRQKGEPDVGKFTLTLRRAADGRWLIMSDMDNGNARAR